jgi:hypothetical protein
MQLDEFVKTSLEQLVSGVRQAQQAVAGMGAAINPSVRSSPPGRMHSNGTVIQDVAFDVAVTTSETGGSKAGLRVGWAAVGAGVEGKSSNEHSEVSRIKFVIPVGLPAPETPR